MKCTELNYRRSEASESSSVKILIQIARILLSLSMNAFYSDGSEGHSVNGISLYLPPARALVVDFPSCTFGGFVLCSGYALLARGALPHKSQCL